MTSQTTERPKPIDNEERDRVGSELDTTLFVEAGAGSGKTSALVGRVVSLIAAGTPIDAIAAITFTEAAAAELRTRVREKLIEELERSPNPEVEARLRTAVVDADGAAISTLHGFAQRLLAEHPVEAGLPPRIEVLDEIRSELAFAERWRDFLEAFLNDEPNAPAIRLAIALGLSFGDGISGQSFRIVAKLLNDQWDRCEEFADQPRTPMPAIEWGPVLKQLGKLEHLLPECNDHDDKLRAEIATTIDSTKPLRSAIARPGSTDDAEFVRMIDQLPSPKAHVGKAQNWADISEARNTVNTYKAAVGDVRDQTADGVLRLLLGELSRFTQAAAAARRADGQLEFHDLLVLATRLLRDHPEARTALHRRYQRLLLDEFQDTDPIQIEMATLLAAPPDADVADHWSNADIDGGRLFFVGDPKQSIYRFRRADIALFLKAKSRFGGGDGANTVQLVSNFRTVPSVLEFVNDLFGQLMGRELPGQQPEYAPLVPYRPELPGIDHRPLVIGGSHPPETPTGEKRSAGTMRTAEAADVAAVVADIVARPERWQIGDGNDGWRDPALADICVLVPSRSSLGHLNAAFDNRGIPFRAETSTLVYSTAEVVELMGALASIDDPGNKIAVVATLRSPLFGCTDPELASFAEAGGRFDPTMPARQARIDDGTIAGDDPVLVALRQLGDWHDERYWLEPAQLLERIIATRSVMEAALVRKDPRGSLRRTRFLIDQARMFAESKGGSLREFLEWARLQSAESARVHEPMLPETDHEAVGVMTIHGSKGLEFPITIVSGMTGTLGGKRPGARIIFDDDGAHLKLKSDTTTIGFEEAADFEASMDAHEQKRLLYVALTRARDHLVVSAHHSVPKSKTSTTTSYGRIISEAIGLEDKAAEPTDGEGEEAPTTTDPKRWRTLADLEIDPLSQLSAPPAVTPAPPTTTAKADDALVEAFVAFTEARRVRLVQSAHSRSVSATEVAKRAAKAEAEAEAAEGEDPSQASDTQRPWRRGRAGTAIGQAVHAVLQTVDLATGADIEALAINAAETHGVPTAVAEVTKLARAALGAPIVGEATTTGRFWREVYVAAPVSADPDAANITEIASAAEPMIEGYVDLLVETADGSLVVVDYKTDSVSNESDIEAKLARYRLQGATYAIAIEDATGVTVSGCEFIFLTTRGAIQRSVIDLSAAKLEARHLART